MAGKMEKCFAYGLVVLVAVVILYVAVDFFFTSETSVYKAVRWKITESNKKIVARQAAEKKEQERYPEQGDRIVFDGEEIVIMKEYFWTAKYKVRLPDGTFTDLLREELKDKKPIQPHRE